MWKNIGNASPSLKPRMPDSNSKPTRWNSENDSFCSYRRKALQTLESNADKLSLVIFSGHTDRAQSLSHIGYSNHSSQTGPVAARWSSGSDTSCSCISQRHHGRRHWRWQRKVQLKRKTDAPGRCWLRTTRCRRKRYRNASHCEKRHNEEKRKKTSQVSSRMNGMASKARNKNTPHQ